MRQSRRTGRRDIPGCPRETIIIFVWVRSFWINRGDAPRGAPGSTDRTRVRISPPRVVPKIVTVGIRRNSAWAWNASLFGSLSGSSGFLSPVYNMLYLRYVWIRTRSWPPGTNLSLAFIILARRRPGTPPGIVIACDRNGDWWNPYGGIWQLPR